MGWERGKGSALLGGPGLEIGVDVEDLHEDGAIELLTAAAERDAAGLVGLRRVAEHTAVALVRAGADPGQVVDLPLRHVGERLLDGGDELAPGEPAHVLVVGPDLPTNDLELRDEAEVGGQLDLVQKPSRLWNEDEAAGRAEARHERIADEVLGLALEPRHEVGQSPEALLSRTVVGHGGIDIHEFTLKVEHDLRCGTRSRLATEFRRKKTKRQKN